MKLRFEIDQAACFRKGIDAPKSIVTIEVDPSELPLDQREMIADRLNGIDVCTIDVSDVHVRCQGASFTYSAIPGKKPRFFVSSHRIKAETPTLEALLSALRTDDKRIREIMTHLEVDESENTPEAFASGDDQKESKS